MKATAENIREAQELLASAEYGVLSSISVQLEGTPFGSVASYCRSSAGHPLIFISTIAQHTLNILADPRVSLTVLAGPGADVQAEARLTISGEAKKCNVDGEEEQRYFSYFPAAEGYRKFHDFACYEIVPSAVRFIGGFGKIFWMDKSDFFEPSPLDQQSHDYVVGHMNKEHSNNLADYLKAYLNVSAEGEAKLIAVEEHGMDIIADGRKYRVPNLRPIRSADDAHHVMVDMAKDARIKLS